MTACLTIWYDASCPLCATEMQALQRHAGPDRLRLVDCSPRQFHDTEVAAAGLERTDLMRLIHARDESGQWLRGVEVFARAYRLAGMTSVADVFANRHLRPVLDRVYPWIARHRIALSRLGLDVLYGRAIDYAARQAACRALACGNGGCDSGVARF